MNILYTVLALIIGFSLLVIVHEFGHFITARMFGVRTEEFAIGFGPKLFSKKLKTVEFSLRAVPLGGFVRFTDSEDADGNPIPEYANDPTLLEHIKIWKRAVIYAAGAVMNLVLGFVLLVTVYLSIGMPTNLLTVGDVISGSPAELGGLQKNDIFLRVNGEEIVSDSYEKAIEQLSGFITDKPMEITVLRNGEELVLENVVPQYSEEDEAYKLGFYFGYTYTAMPFSVALDLSWKTSKEMMTLLYDALSKLFFKGEGFENLTGPIGVVKVVKEATKESFLDVVSIFIALTFNLAVVNLLPFPALDGGKIVLLLLEAIRKKPLKRQTEGMLNFVGLALLLLLSIVISIKDVFM